MMIQTKYEEKLYQANLLEGLDISLPIREGLDNPNCYYADPVVFETIEIGSFVGSVKKGGSVNYQKLSLTPHGNGTHTECYGHIVADSISINQCLNQFHFITRVISIAPTRMENGDSVITLSSFLEKIGNETIPEAILIRTLPNEYSKQNRQYSGSNPPYVDAALMAWLAKKNVKQFLIDLPSVDKEIDGGLLAAHKAFWNLPDKPRKNACITELIFVPDAILDGLYLMNLQIISLEMDASPSKPILYPIELF